VDPFSAHQIVSWFLLIVSLYLVAQSFYFLRRRGQVENQRSADVPLIGVEKTTRLVKAGAYRYVRHPLYGSLLFLGWGLFFKDPSSAGFGLALGASAFLLATARIEEAENLRYFGNAYREYMAETRMFVPFLF
jgi:protein-S-isoprenylcysteine O-methyltransferase Ste14